MQKTPYFRDVAIQLIMNLGKNNVPISFCDSKNICQQSTINLNLWNAKSKQLSMFAAIGFTPGDIEKNRINVPGVNFSTAVKNSFSDLVNLTKFFVIMIKQILTGNIPFATLIGPFKFFEAIIDSFQQGLTTFLYFIVNFSLAMAIANLLPIPSLDGGGIIYCLLEKIRGKPLSIALEELIYRLVFIAFAMFFTQLIVNDLKYYF
jgi:regulator of sigma E protease